MTIMKQRTSAELLSADFNYYIFFNISPDETDVAVIEQAIRAEQNKWVLGLPIQRRYAELIDDVVSVMINDLGYDEATGGYTRQGARADELKAAKQLKLAAAVKLIAEICRRNGKIFQSRIIDIAAADGYRWFTELELSMAVNEQLGQEFRCIDDTVPYARAPWQRTDVPDISDILFYSKLDGILLVANKSDLYDLLGCERTAELEELKMAIKSEQSKEQSRMTAELAAREKLLQIAQIVFDTQGSRRDYDNYTAVSHVVWEPLKLRADYGLKELTMTEFCSYAAAITVRLDMDMDQVTQLLFVGLGAFGIKVICTADDM